MIQVSRGVCTEFVRAPRDTEAPGSTSSVRRIEFMLFCRRHLVLASAGHVCGVTLLGSGPHWSIPHLSPMTQIPPSRHLASTDFGLLPSPDPTLTLTRPRACDI